MARNVKYLGPVLILWCCAASVASATENMHAVVLSDGNFQLQTLPRPEPQAGQVRIKVRAASVNPGGLETGGACRPRGPADFPAAISPVSSMQ